jgi:3-dehydroquinate synthase
MDELVVGGVTRVWIGARPRPEEVLGDVAARRVAVMVQPGVPATIGRRFAAGISGIAVPIVIEVPDGEAAKTFAVADEVCRRLAAGGLERSDLIVGVGGGALTDLAGFVAGVFLRGIRVHYTPTTLVGAIDAAIGGKSGLNLDAKNLVGLFRHPARVVIDTEVIAGLPRPLLRQGVAEALKAGMIGDPGLVDLLEANGLDAPAGEVVSRAIRVKTTIVERDFRDEGERAHLNYGHTIGHAVEIAGGMSHGEAVAVGMVAAGRVSALLAGFTGEERQRAIIARLGLPTAASEVSADAVRGLLDRDKKRAQGALRMVVLDEVARPRVVVVDDATVTAALAAVGIGEG